MCCSRYLLTFFFYIPVPYDEKDIFWGFLVLESLIGLQFQLPVTFNCFGIGGWGVDLNYHDAEWFALGMNWNCSIIFQIAPKYCMLDFFVDYG